MRLKFSPEIQALLNRIKSLIPPDQEIYLVGGALRDVMLGRDVHDLDFVMPGNPTHLARKLARSLNAGFFVLDDERCTSRVLHCDSVGNQFALDFVIFTGQNLLEDLENRDFTINAMAVSLNNSDDLIDPLNGQNDLKDGILRVCSRYALNDDPIRVLRAIRLVNQLDFDYAEDLYPLLHSAAQNLTDTSPERQRDEFFKILEGPDPCNGLNDVHRFDGFDRLIPEILAQESVPASPPHELPLFEHTLSAVDGFNQIMRTLSGERKVEHGAWWLQLVYDELSQFINDIKVYFNTEITPGRRKRGLALFGALLHDVGKPSTMSWDELGRMHYYGHDLIGAETAWQISKRMQLSNAESDWVKIFIRHHMDLLSWTNLKDPVSVRAKYRFFQRVGDVGVAIALFFLADTQATYCQHLTKDQWLKSIQVTKQVLSAWWQEKERFLRPEPLLNGHEIQHIFELSPGRQIGVLLDSLVEAQVSGEISTKEDAIDFLQVKLKAEKKKMETDEGDN